MRWFLEFWKMCALLIAPRFLENVWTLNHHRRRRRCSATKSLGSRSVVHIENANSSAVDSGPYKT
jgi:hypothetical protein